MSSETPCPAGLVDKAEDWKFGSLYAGLNGSGKISLDSSFRPRDGGLVRPHESPDDRKRTVCLRQSVRRGIPFGTKAWTSRTAENLGPWAPPQTPGSTKKP